MVIEKIVRIIGRGYALCTTLPEGKLVRENDKVSINGNTYSVNRVEVSIKPLGNRYIISREAAIFVSVSEEVAKTFKENDEIIIVE